MSTPIDQHGGDPSRAFAAVLWPRARQAARQRRHDSRVTRISGRAAALKRPRRVIACGPLCLTCGKELELTAEGWASPDGSTTCARTGRPHDVRQVVPDSPEDRA